MPTFDESFPEIESALAARYGRRQVAGRDDPFAAMVAVVLERSVEAKKAARAVAGLAESGLLDPQALAESDPLEVVEALKASGVSVPARVVGPLRRLAAWLVDRHHGSADLLVEEGSASTSELREELAGLNGISLATADAILLQALRRAVYPVDRATYRILARHAWVDPSADYEEVRSLVERPGLGDPEALAQLSDWLDQVGRESCRASVAKCERCPLRPFLPEGGPREPDGS